MKVGTIDSIYDAIFENNTIIVKDQSGQIIGSRGHILNYRPIAGFDLSDQVAMEELAIEIVDEFNKEK